MIASAPPIVDAGSRAARCGSCTRSRTGGDRRRARAARRRRSCEIAAIASGSSIAPSSWRVTVGVGARARAACRRSSSSVSPAPRLSPQIGSTLSARRAQQRRAGRTSPSAACARGGARSSSPGSGSVERADHAAGVARRAVRVAELHPVRVEARRRRRRRARPSARHAAKRRRGPLVAVAVARMRRAAGSAGPSCASSAASSAARSLVVDHVVGWSDERIEARRRPRRSRSGRRQTARSRARGAPGFGNATGCTTATRRRARKARGEHMRRPDDGSTPTSRSRRASRLLADDNAHAAVIALEHARELEPAKGSVREALARAYYRTGPLPRRGARVPRPPSTSNRSTTTRTTALGLCRLRAGDRTGARGHLRQAIVMRPDNADYRARSAGSTPERTRRARTIATVTRVPPVVCCDLDGVIWRGDDADPGRGRRRSRRCGRRACASCSSRTTRAAASRDYVGEARAPRASTPRPTTSRTSAQAAAALVAANARRPARGARVRGSGRRRGARGVRLRRRRRGRRPTRSSSGWHRDFDFDGLRRAADAVRAGALLRRDQPRSDLPGPNGLLPGAGSIVAAVATAAGRTPDRRRASRSRRWSSSCARASATAGVMVGDRPSTDGALRGRARLAVRRWCCRASAGSRGGGTDARSAAAASSRPISARLRPCWSPNLSAMRRLGHTGPVGCAGADG